MVITDPPYEAECHTSHRLVARAGGKLEVEPLTFPAITEEQRTESARHMARLARRSRLAAPSTSAETTR